MTAQLAQITIRGTTRVLVAEISGEIDMSNATDLRQAVLAPLRGEAAGVVLDLTKVSYLDSAAIHMIYELRDRLMGRGLQLAIALPPDAPTLTALKLTGVPDVVATHPDADAAVAAMAA